MSQTMNFLKVSNKFRATKTFIWKNGKWELLEGYDAGMFFKGFEFKVGSLKECYEILKQNQEYPVFMIHGTFIDGIDKTKMIRRTRENPDKRPPTITNRNMNLFCFDIDGYKGSHDIDLFIKENLPVEFHNADYFYQYSSSYGLTTDELKCHIFFWLEKATYNIKIRDWIKTYNKVKGWGNIIDPAPLNAAQPVYTQKRICEGAEDPVDDFIGYVEKSGALDFDFDIVEVKNESKTIIPTQTDDYDLKYGIEQILKADNYHEELNKLALSLINRKMPVDTVKQLLQGAMNSAETKDRRWQDRYDDIGRSVDSAADIVNNPTIEEVLCWIESEDTIVIKANFAGKLLNLNPIDRTTAIVMIQKKIKYGVADIKKTIKIAEKERDLMLKEAAREQKSKDRKNQGIYEIEVKVNNRGITAERVSKLLANSKKSPQVFHMAKGLVSISLEKPATIRQAIKSNDLKKDYPDIPIIKTYQKPFHSLSGRLEQDVVFVDENGNDTDCPITSLSIIGDGEHKDFKPLTGIVEAPFLDSDFNLVKKTGYNETTGLYTLLHRKLKIKKLKSEKAYDYLCSEVLAEFPFASNLDRVVAIAAMMTCVQRPTIAGDTGFPGFGIVSPTQSSGKTTLAQLISYSVFNRPVAATSLSDDEDELKKHLLGILREGHSCVMFDNINQGKNITSNALGSIMSSDVFSHRLLGVNITVSVPCSVVWLFTGNGISFVGDFATRVYPIVIDTKMENPDTRIFKRHDIGQWALDNRKKILSALLSIIYEGKDLKADGGSRFKQWDKFVRQPLLKVSGIDINEAIRKNQTEDPIFISRRNLFREMYNTFKSDKFTTKQLIKMAFGTFENEETPLGDALEENLSDKCKNQQRVGMFLNSLDGQNINGVFFHKITTSTYNHWLIIKKE